ncbi:MAG: hypothetical protein QOG50_647 [Actinomycetota bacterium]|nr:hypothetical protein [Actinomycetota bacterium]
MRRYLVVANQTVGGSRLVDELSERALHDYAAFDVLVPATPPTDHLAWTEGGAGLQAPRRLSQILRHLDAAAIGATGSVGDDVDPVDAVDNAVRRNPYDEIIVATPPAGPSRWIHFDLPHRLARRTRLPVTPVIVARDREAAPMSQP